MRTHSSGLLGSRKLRRGSVPFFFFFFGFTVLFLTCVTSEERSVDTN